LITTDAPYPMSEDYFRNLTSKANSICSIAVIGDATISPCIWFDGGSWAERSASFAGQTFTYTTPYGTILTIPNCEVYSNFSQIYISNYDLSTAIYDTNPIIIEQNNSQIHISNCYGSGDGSNLNSCDDTSVISISGYNGIRGGVDQVASFSGGNFSSYTSSINYGLFSLSPNLIPQPSLKNDVLSPLYGDSPAATGSNPPIVTYGIDANIGPYMQFACPASSWQINHTIQNTDARNMVSFLLQSSVDASILVSIYPSVKPQYVPLHAGQWHRIVWWCDAAISGSKYFVIAPNDTTGPTLKMANFHTCAGAVGLSLNYTMNAILNGGYNPKVYGPQQAYSTNSSTSASTVLAVADISGGSEEHALNLTGAITTASNAQLPTAAALAVAIPWAAVGQTYKLRVINSGGSVAGVWTLIQASDTSWTLNGAMTVAVGAYTDFYVTLTSLTAAVLQRIGSGTL